MKTRHQDLQQRVKGWLPRSPINLNGGFIVPPILSARTQTCSDDEASKLAERFLVAPEFFATPADAVPETPRVVLDPILRKDG